MNSFVERLSKDTEVLRGTPCVNKGGEVGDQNPAADICEKEGVQYITKNGKELKIKLKMKENRIQPELKNDEHVLCKHCILSYSC